MFVFIPGPNRPVRLWPAGTVLAEISIREVRYLKVYLVIITFEPGFSFLLHPTKYFSSMVIG